jgi:hypothetical protein
MSSGSPKLPAIQFYTGDWFKAADVAMCSPATRGIWFDAICAMHDSDRSGTLVGTADQLIRVLRCSLPELHAAIAELKATGAADVTERNGVVTLVNRRMQRIYKERVAVRERVAKHRGNGRVTRGKPPPSSSIASSTSSPSPLVADGAAPENQNPDTRAELAAFGVSGTALNRCAAVPGLTPVVAVLVCEKAKRAAKENPPGWLITYLTSNGFHPPKVIPTEDVYRLAKDGRIGAVAGHELHPTEANVGHGSGFVEFTDAGGTKRRVRAEQLTPDAITITVAQGRLQPCN